MQIEWTYMIVNDMMVDNIIYNIKKKRSSRCYTRKTAKKKRKDRKWFYCLHCVCIFCHIALYCFVYPCTNSFVIFLLDVAFCLINGKCYKRALSSFNIKITLHATHTITSLIQSRHTRKQTQEHQSNHKKITKPFVQG